MDCSMPGFSLLQYLWEFTQIHVLKLGDAIQLSHPLLPSSPPALNLFQHQGLFQWISSSHQVVKVLELQLHHRSFQWIFRVDFLWVWLVWSPCCPRDSPVQTLWSLHQHCNLKASILWCTVFFTAQSSHPYMTTGKTIALIVQTFIGEVMSLLFNTLSRFVIAFLPRTRHLLIWSYSHYPQWLWSPRK